MIELLIKWLIELQKNSYSVNDSCIIVEENHIKFIMKNSHLSIKITELAAWDISKSSIPINSDKWDANEDHDKIINRFHELQGSSGDYLSGLIIDYILDTNLTRYNDALKLKKGINVNRNLIDRIKYFVAVSYHNFINSAILFFKRS